MLTSFIFALFFCQMQISAPQLRIIFYHELVFDRYGTQAAMIEYGSMAKFTCVCIKLRLCQQLSEPNYYLLILQDRNERTVNIFGTDRNSGHVQGRLIMNLTIDKSIAPNDTFRCVIARMNNEKNRIEETIADDRFTVTVPYIMCENDGKCERKSDCKEHQKSYCYFDQSGPRFECDAFVQQDFCNRFTVYPPQSFCLFGNSSAVASLCNALSSGTDLRLIVGNYGDCHRLSAYHFYRIDTEIPFKVADYVKWKVGDTGPIVGMKHGPVPFNVSEFRNIQCALHLMNGKSVPIEIVWNDMATEIWVNEKDLKPHLSPSMNRVAKMHCFKEDSVVEFFAYVVLFDFVVTITPSACPAVGTPILHCNVTESLFTKEAIKFTYVWRNLDTGEVAAGPELKITEAAMYQCIVTVTYVVCSPYRQEISMVYETEAVNCSGFVVPTESDEADETKKDESSERWWVYIVIAFAVIIVAVIIVVWICCCYGENSKFAQRLLAIFRRKSKTNMDVSISAITTASATLTAPSSGLSSLDSGKGSAKKGKKPTSQPKLSESLKKTTTKEKPSPMPVPVPKKTVKEKTSVKSAKKK